MSQPIPRRSLPHSITLEPYVKRDGAATTYGSAVTVKFVRVEAARQSAAKSLGDMKDDKLVVYWDAVNTVPAGTIPKTKDRVTFGDQVVTVRVAQACYGNGPAVHHWEVFCGGN